MPGTTSHLSSKVNAFSRRLPFQSTHESGEWGQVASAGVDLTDIGRRYTFKLEEHAPDITDPPSPQRRLAVPQSPAVR